MSVSQEMYDGLRQEMVRHIAKYKIFPGVRELHIDLCSEVIDWDDPVVKATCTLRADAYVRAIERKLKIKVGNEIHSEIIRQGVITWEF